MEFEGPRALELARPVAFPRAVGSTGESRAAFFILSQLSAKGCSPEAEGVEDVGRFLLAILRNLDLPPYPGGGALPGPKDRPES